MRLPILFLALVSSASAEPTSDPFPGRHVFDSRWLNDTSAIEHDLEHVPWTQKCELRRHQYHTGFSLEAKVGADGRLQEERVAIFWPFGAKEEPALEACLLEQVSTLEPFDVSTGFTPGREGAGEITYQYFLP